MRILTLKAENFRNIGKCTLHFSEGVNLLYGENAQGKTNALEAIYLFARGKSFRTSDERELIRFGAEGMSASILYEDADGEQEIEYAVFGRERRRVRNGVKLGKVTEMIGHFRAVLFTPGDLCMVQDGPDARRAFLNVAISQCYPSYIKTYARYKALLDQRNALLRSSKQGKEVDMGELFAFSDEMAEVAALLRETRTEYVRELDRFARPFLFDLSDGKEKMTVQYESDVPEAISDRKEAEAEYRRIFTSALEREMAVGTSLYGIQRDDLDIRIGGISARNFGSQGQQRSIVLALKLAEGEVSRAISGDYPVFLFDDVMSELDEKRRSYLLTAAKDRQIILTSCELQEGLFRTIFGDLRVFLVSGGEYRLLSGGEA